jgi:hypothetical protein
MVKINKTVNTALTLVIALVWLINGLFCKLLGFVPRHALIVSEILGFEYAAMFTMAIGVAEILMVVWIFSGIKSRFCAVFQIIIVAVMNIMEFFLVPGLLLFGKLNIVFASLFIAIIYVNEFVLKRAESKYAIK